MKAYTIPEVAERLNKSPRTVRSYIKIGRLHAELYPGTYGNEYRITQLELEKFLDESTSRPQETVTVVDEHGSGRGFAEGMSASLVIQQALSQALLPVMEELAATRNELINMTKELQNAYQETEQYKAKTVQLDQQLQLITSAKSTLEAEFSNYKETYSQESIEEITSQLSKTKEELAATKESSEYNLQEWTRLDTELNRVKKELAEERSKPWWKKIIGR